MTAPVDLPHRPVGLPIHDRVARDLNWSAWTAAHADVWAQVDAGLARARRLDLILAVMFLLLGVGFAVTWAVTK